MLLAFGTVAALTYVVDYALMFSHGGFLRAGAPDDPTVLRLSHFVGGQRGATLARLPLFAAYLVLVFHLVGATRRELDSAPRHDGSLTPGR